MTASLRHIEFEGTRNFRDLGGIPTASGTTHHGIIFRSDRLSNLTSQDHTQLANLGVTTVIDMRVADERDRAPNRLPDDGSVQQIAREFLPRHTARMFDTINSGELDVDTAHTAMLAQYQTLALEHTKDYGNIINDLLEHSATPSVFHCTSGKDRTGMVAAIILLALEAPEDAVVADYVMTEGRIDKIDLFSNNVDPQVIDVVMAANPDYINTAIGAMKTKFGSVAAYLRDGVGITVDKQNLLRTLLLG